MTADGFHLFCEGESGSIDQILLNRIVRTHQLQVIVVPAGGKVAIKNFARGKLGGDADFLCFRDRDFDKTPQAPGLIRIGDKILATHRACVESYLIDAALMNQFWVRHATPLTKSNFPSIGIDDFQTWILNSAKSIRYHQSILWALADLKIEKSSPLNIARSDETVKMLGSHEREHCLKWGRDIWANYLTKTGQAKEVSFDRECQRYIERFDEPNFYANHDYLIWFHGKDLKKALARHLPTFAANVKRFLKDYFKWAPDHLDLDRFADFRELVELLKEKSN